MPFRIHPSGLTVTIRLTPNARKCAFGDIIEISDNQRALKVSVNVVPEDGKANAALISFLAKNWKLPKSSLSVLSGHTNRVKVILIEGDGKKLMEQLNIYRKNNPE